jgi:hypothetical protein
MKKHRFLSAILTLVVMTVMFTSCGEAKSATTIAPQPKASSTIEKYYSETPSTTSPVVIPTGEAFWADMPVMAGLNPATAAQFKNLSILEPGSKPNEFIFGENYIIRCYYTDPPQIEKIKAYYRVEMPKNGWEILSDNKDDPGEWRLDMEKNNPRIRSTITIGQSLDYPDYLFVNFDKQYY